MKLKTKPGLMGSYDTLIFSDYSSTHDTKFLLATLPESLMDQAQEEGNQKTVVGAPVPDMGENRYLTHFTSEILSGDDLAGYLLFTRYSYQRAFEDEIPLRWMIRRDSYIELVKDLVIDPGCLRPRLPLDIDECIDNVHGTVIILDDITCMTGKHHPKIYLEAIQEMLTYCSEKSDALLIYQPESLAKYLEGIETNPVRFWRDLGVPQSEGGHFLYSSAFMGHSQSTSSRADS